MTDEDDTMASWSDSRTPPVRSRSHGTGSPAAQLASDVRRLRERQALTQADLARRIGTTSAAIRRIESPEHGWSSLEILPKLAEVLDARLDVRLLAREHATTLDEFAEIDRYNFEQTREALERFHPGALATIQHAVDLFGILAQAYADNCRLPDAQAALNRWLEGTCGSPADLTDMLEQATLLGPDVADDAALAKEGLEEGRADVVIIWLFQRLRRDFLFGLGELLRLRLTPAIGYLRLQTETCGFILLFREEPRSAWQWMSLAKGTGGRAFYRDHQARLKERLSTVGLSEYYDQGSEWALHSRVFGIAGGVSRGPDPDESGTDFNLSYQELGGDSFELFTNTGYYLIAHRRIARALVERVPELEGNAAKQRLEELEQDLGTWSARARRFADAGVSP